LEGLKGEESISEICRREDIAPGMYYNWSKSFCSAQQKTDDSCVGSCGLFPRSLFFKSNRKEIA
jgi:hypothetical protein